MLLLLRLQSVTLIRVTMCYFIVCSPSPFCMKKGLEEITFGPIPIYPLEPILKGWLRTRVLSAIANHLPGKDKNKDNNATGNPVIISENETQDEASMDQNIAPAAPRIHGGGHEKKKPSQGTQSEREKEHFPTTGHGEQERDREGCR